MKKNSVYFLALGIIFLLAACATQSTPLKTGDKVVDGKLYEVINARVDVAYLDPSIDFNRYSKVLVHPLAFDQLKIIQPSDNSYRSLRNAKFELTDKDKEQIDKIFQKAVADALQKRGSFAVVGNKGADVLALAVEVLQIQPNAPKDDWDSRRPGVRIYSEGAGSMIIGAVISDSVSGEQIAIFADHKDSSQMMRENNRISNLADVSQMFYSWGTQLNQALKGLQEEK